MITNAALGAKWRGKDRWLNDGGLRGSGSLVAKIGERGVVFYFKYVDADNKRRHFLIGSYNSDGYETWQEEPEGAKRGFMLIAARDRAGQLSVMYRNGAENLHQHFERKSEAKERAHRAVKEAERLAKAAAQRSTLLQLLQGYVAHLERAGKQSAGDVKSLFSNHVYEAAPDMAGRRAADIPVDDFVGLIGKVAEAEKGRTAAKLRSYLRAAFSLAIRSKTDPAAPLTLRTFGIETNPIASIGALSQFNRVRDRNLSAEELQAFLKRLEAVPAGVKKAVLELCLLLGGQRPAQLLRVRPVDLDLSGGLITLYDPKGSRKQPRAHVLPLPKRAAEILRKVIDELPEGAPFIFTSDGKRALRPETVSKVVTDISTEMVKEKEAREGFELRDLRRTCETMLASLRVSSDIRAQIQSHGLGGVQARHYDRHGYGLEKRQTLELWQRHLARIAAGKLAKVMPIQRKSA